MACITRCLPRFGAVCCTPRNSKACRYSRPLIAHLGISGVQVENYGGKSNLAPFLKALKNRSGFTQVLKLKILRDGDDDPAGAESSVGTAIAQAAFPDELTISRLILPGGGKL